MVSYYIMDNKDYIKYIKSHFCMVCGKSPVDPDHLEAIGMGGDRKKPTLKDYSCIPLCREHHSERLSIGNIRFEKKHNLNLWKEVFHLFRKYIFE